MDWRDFRGEGWRLWEWERGSKLHKPHRERIWVRCGQLIPLSVFEEASVEVEKLQMTHCDPAQSHHSSSVLILLFSRYLMQKAKDSKVIQLAQPKPTAPPRQVPGVRWCPAGQVAAPQLTWMSETDLGNAKKAKAFLYAYFFLMENPFPKWMLLPC